ncbi:hypothetical protein F4861DRAFT_352909 [Xylaria intraflava]|nr:hypothetical protein F4861DRAFT_352909 [Xylaria intraflava]
MLDVPSNEENTLGSAIARMCDDVVLQLDAQAAPRTANPEFGYLRAHISSLSWLLKKAPSLESAPGLSSAILDCRLALIKIKELISHTPANQTGDREQMTAHMHSLIDAHNTLSLGLKLEADESDLRILKLGLENLSREAIAAADILFSRQRPRHETRGKFAVWEQELRVLNPNKKPRSTYEIICPRADFEAVSGYGPSSGNAVKFVCCCDDPGESHDSRLRYRQLQVETLPGPSELVQLGAERAWEIALYKKSTGAIVLIKLVGVVPTYIPELEEWVLNRAIGWALTHRMTKDMDQTGLSYAVSTPDSLLLRTAVCGDSFRNRLPRKIVTHAPQGDVQLDIKLSDIYTCYYSRARWDDIDGRNEHRKQLSKLLLPKAWATLLFSTGQTSPDRMQGNNSFVVYIFLNSTIVSGKDHSKGPLWVSFSRVQVHQAAVTMKCDVSFEFNSLEDAETFARRVKNMRQRLLQAFVQGAFADEAEVYVQESGASSAASHSSDLPRTKISVIASEQAESKPPEMRMVVTTDGFPGSLCLDFGTNILQVCKMGLQNSYGLVRFWRQYYDERAIPITEESNWHKLVSQQRDGVRVRQPQSSGGPQIVRNKTRTAEDWLDNTDQLRTVMASCDKQDEYDRVRVCVIDTGLREDYRPKCSAFRDFVDPENRGVCDKSTSGHGTLCAHIILSIFDQCELYVARVFADDNVDEKTGSARMADAIEWALSKEVCADIISISAGFQEESPRLEEAVRKANAKGKLIFASASNWGNVNRVAFPARHSSTICIYSTNTADNPSDFNPGPQQNSDNFALIGEGWQSHVDPKKYEKGTSMATAAAAGLAALILDFSRQRDNRGTFWGGQVRQVSSMAAIFHAISKPAGGFRCVEPRYLLKDYGFTPATASDVARPSQEELRDWVKYKIEDTMRRKALGIHL